jgi:monovalent cation/hydrogen antiporter
MAALELVLLLLAASSGVRLLADRWRVPYPSALVVGGAVLALIPGLPRAELPPDILFLIFIPPLLYWAAVSYPLRDARRLAGPITRLAVILVLVSTAAVAVVIHRLDSAFTWASAFALGAIIAPPDPVAVISIMRSLRLPHDIQSVLEGEGLFNDVTALVTYRVAVAAAVTGSFAFGHAAVAFAIAALAGVGIGLAVGWVALRVHRLARNSSPVEMTVSLLTPFASYLAADQVGASGVLAIVATGLYTARGFPRVVRPEARVQSVGMWNVVTFLLESLVFILVGLELPQAVRAFGRSSLPALFIEAAIVTLVVIAVRFIWVAATVYPAFAIERRIARGPRPSPEFRTVAFVGWAGLRGGDSLVIALALPFTTMAGTAFPGREQTIFITFAVIFVSLVLQGPTLPYAARALRLRRGGSDEAEEAHARLVAVEAGLSALDGVAVKTGAHPELVRYLRRRHLQRARRWAARERSASQTQAPWLRHEHFVNAPSHAGGALDDSRAVEYRQLRRAMIEAELQSVLDLRDNGVIDDAVMRRVQRDLDFESLLLDTPEPVSEPPREVGGAL